jgi:hypothetical protein
MREIRIVLDENEIKKLTKLKAHRTWKQCLIDGITKGEEQT